MFRAALSWVMRQAEVTPDYSAKDCVSAHGGACELCATACPHQAITVRRTVTIDPVDCSGCGLCVAACPSLALSPRGRPRSHPNPLRCSRVQGEGASVTCLAQLQPSDLAAMAQADAEGTVRLAHADCADCPVGAAHVPQVVEAAAQKARGLLEVAGGELRLELEQTVKLEVQPDRRALSRRELLHGGWNELRRAGGDAVAPLDKALDQVSGRARKEQRTPRIGGKAVAPTEPEERAPLPAELQRRLAQLRQAEPAPEQPVPWPLPALLDGCILCPACTRACPSDAIRRVFDGDASGGVRLELEAARCSGCAACVQACPVGVVVMRTEVPWSEVEGPLQLLHQAGPPPEVGGAVSRAR